MVPSPWPMRVGQLLLREARESDIERMLSFRNDPAVNRFMLRTSVDPETFREEWLAVPTSDNDFSCVAELDGTVVAIGFLEVVDGMGQPGLPKHTEGLLGYVVEPGSSGKGVASDLARGLLAAAFDRLGLRRVTAGCNADNPASARVLEKAGMRREQHGIEDSWHAELGWVDGYQYAILAREWHAARERRDDLVPGCFPCDQQAEVVLPPREDVVHTAHWRVAHAFNSVLPGWLVLIPTRHVASFTELTPEAADELGGLVRRLGAALEVVTGCVKTYLMQFSEAEGFSHLHLHLVPRLSDHPEDARGPRVFAYLTDDQSQWLSTSARDTIALSVRAALDC
jgi:RimJ/RimL family protein N-acetyltransferase/diadenosine tetraphosphate (Ap4A) HIT family hydrolase